MSTEGVYSRDMGRGNSREGGGGEGGAGREVGVDAKWPELGQVVAHQAPLRLLDELCEHVCVACPPEIAR